MSGRFCRALVAFAAALQVLLLAACAQTASRKPPDPDEVPKLAAPQTDHAGRPPAPPATRRSALPPLDVGPPVADAPPPPSAQDVLRRLAAALTDLRCEDAATMRAANSLLRQPSMLEAKIDRVLPLLDYVLGEIEKRDMPGQFALVPWAESGFRADPGNRGSVQGMWQFTVATGRAHGLRIDARYDGRRSAIESTEAALDHLQKLMLRFEDWRLAILAYNAGEYRLAGALRRRQTAGPDGLPSGLAPHSYVYLHKIEALACLLRDPAASQITVSAEPFEPLRIVDRPTGISSNGVLARTAGIEPEDLLRFNAAFRGGDIADDAPRRILLPLSAAERLEGAPPGSWRGPENLASAEDPPLRPRVHTVSGGDTLWRIARRYRIALEDLLAWNRLTPKSVIRPGQRLQLGPR